MPSTITKEEATVSIETFGCSANHADSELLRHHAAAAGYRLVDGTGEVVILNTCTVKGPTQTAIEKRIQLLENEGKKVVVAGCLSQASPENPLFRGKSLLGPDTVDQVSEALSATLNSSPIQITKRSKSPLPLLPPSKNSDANSPFILSVSQGCLSSCSFCMTKLARGNLRSHTVRHLRDVTRTAIEMGHKEVYLTSQDTSAYGFDIGVTLVDLLAALIEIKGEFKIRIGMANPQHFKLFLKELWPLFQSDKLYRFLHVPLQSGSNTVLDHMRREHSAEDYLSIVGEGRSLYPDLTIATDIICGYPTETGEDHQLTLAALRRSMPDAVNISRFWPRPKTRAERLPELPGSLVKGRSKEVTELFRRLSRARNRSWLGWQGSVFITEEANARTPRCVGRNYSYKQVLLPKGTVARKGETVAGKIVDYGNFDLRSE